MKIYRMVAVLILCVFSAKLFAGSTAKAEAQFTPEQITGFAKKVEKYAAAQGARAFIIARVGRPPEDLPKGVTFTHTAIAIYSSITLPDGTTAKGYAIHNLYQNDKNLDRSDLVTDYPIDFFWVRINCGRELLFPRRNCNSVYYTLMQVEWIKQCIVQLIRYWQILLMIATKIAPNIR